MPKSPSKAAEIIADSEEEEQPPKPKKKTKVAQASNDDASAANEAGDEDEDEEEYEIEAILDAKNGAFPGGKMGYLVKWKGYDDEHNSWVVQEDAENAQELITEFWEQQKREKKSKSKITSRGRSRKSEIQEDSHEPDEATPSTKRKSISGRKSKSGEGGEQADEPEPEPESEKPLPKKARTSAIKKVKEPTPPPHAKESAMDVDEEVVAEPSHYVPVDDKTREKKSWESLVKTIDTIERIDGVLKVFFTLKTGDKVVETTHVCAKHFPQKLIMFYEANLRWREVETA